MLKILFAIAVLFTLADISFSQELPKSFLPLEDYIDANLRRKINAITPALLPQKPLSKSPSKDNSKVEQKYKYKFMVEFVEDLTSKNAPGQEKTVVKSERRLVRESYFDEQGEIFKVIRLDDASKYIFSVVVYGYLEGEMVGKIRYFAGKPTEHLSKCYQQPYSSKFLYRYDSANRIIEFSRFSCKGDFQDKVVYSHSTDNVKAINYDKNLQVISWSQHYYDQAENEIATEEATLNDYREETIKKLKYTYDEYDTRGNWVKCTVSQELNKDGIAVFEPVLFKYRKIFYY